VLRLTDAPKDKLYDVLAADWKRLVDGEGDGGRRYLHHGGKPVVFVGGSSATDWPGPWPTASIDSSQIGWAIRGHARGRVPVALRGEKDSEWASASVRIPIVISPTSTLMTIEDVLEGSGPSESSRPASATGTRPRAWPRIAHPIEEVDDAWARAASRIGR